MTKLSSIFSPGGARPWGLFNGVLRAELSPIFRHALSQLLKLGGASYLPRVRGSCREFLVSPFPSGKGEFEGRCFPDFKGELSRILGANFSYVLTGKIWT